MKSSAKFNALYDSEFTTSNNIYFDIIGMYLKNGRLERKCNNEETIVIHLLSDLRIRRHGSELSFPSYIAYSPARCPGRAVEYTNCTSAEE